MEWVVAHDRDFAVVRGFEQSRYLLKLVPRWADVILQPQVVVLTTFRKEALWTDDHIGDDSVRRRIALRRAISILDDGHAYRILNGPTGQGLARPVVAGGVVDGYEVRVPVYGVVFCWAASIASISS
jgi:hypothetical protein